MGKNHQYGIVLDGGISNYLIGRIVKINDTYELKEGKSYGVTFFNETKNQIFPEKALKLISAEMAYLYTFLSLEREEKIRKLESDELSLELFNWLDEKQIEALLKGNTK